MDVLKPAGSGFVGSHGPDFIVANDRWSQVLNIRYGHDGQAIFIDWYDKQQCHTMNPANHDRSNGRIYVALVDKSISALFEVLQRMLREHLRRDIVTVLSIKPSLYSFMAGLSRHNGTIYIAYCTFPAGLLRLLDG